MKAIMVTYDSLNRRFLSPYGCDWVQTPNFERLAEKCAVFDTCYVELTSPSSNSPPSMFERSADLSFPSSLLILK